MRAPGLKRSPSELESRSDCELRRRNMADGRPLPSSFRCQYPVNRC